MTGEEDNPYGPVGAPKEDLGGDEEYGNVTPAEDTPEPASPQVEELPGEREGE